MEIELNTYTDLENHLLLVMEYANDEPAKGNKSLTREQCWNLFMGVCIDKRKENKIDTPIYETIKRNVLREFPDWMRTEL